eukprot:m.40363 g.40363  ORF g.40363 m.40363 type:complete len:523 (-) comp8070_c0_seq1:85-1653(-)
MAGVMDVRPRAVTTAATLSTLAPVAATDTEVWYMNTVTLYIICPMVVALVLLCICVGCLWKKSLEKRETERRKSSADLTIKRRTSSPAPARISYNEEFDMIPRPKSQIKRRPTLPMSEAPEVPARAPTRISSLPGTVDEDSELLSRPQTTYNDPRELYSFKSREDKPQTIRKPIERLTPLEPIYSNSAPLESTPYNCSAVLAIPPPPPPPPMPNFIVPKAPPMPPSAAYQAPFRETREDYYDGVGVAKPGFSAHDVAKATKPKEVTPVYDATVDIAALAAQAAQKRASMRKDRQFEQTRKALETQVKENERAQAERLAGLHDPTGGSGVRQAWGSSSKRSPSPYSPKEHAAPVATRTGLAEEAVAAMKARAARQASENGALHLTQIPEKEVEETLIVPKPPPKPETEEDTPASSGTSAQDVATLVEEIKNVGEVDNTGRSCISFGQLCIDSTFPSDQVILLCKRAKRYGILDFSGSLILGKTDATMLTVLARGFGGMIPPKPKKSVAAETATKSCRLSASNA